MYICNHCKRSFEMVKVVAKGYSVCESPFERVLLCPYCDSTDFYEKKTGYCRCCGRKIPTGREYCNETCKKAGEQMWARERENKANRLDNAMYKLIAELTEYNKTHGTRLSYGQYTAMQRDGKAAH